MKDPQDQQTADLLHKPTREQRYRVRQLAMGRRQCGMWITDEERAAIESLLASLRGKADE